MRSPFLNTGVTRASFQQSEDSKYLLKNIDKGVLKNNSCAHSLRQKSGHPPSGSGALVGFSCVSLSNTICGVIVTVEVNDNHQVTEE